jgi:hypothetical protein
MSGQHGGGIVIVRAPALMLTTTCRRARMQSDTGPEHGGDRAFNHDATPQWPTSPLLTTSDQRSLRREQTGSTAACHTALNCINLLPTTPYCSPFLQVNTYVQVRVGAASLFTPKRSLVRSQYRPPGHP